MGCVVLVALSLSGRGDRAREPAAGVVLVIHRAPGAVPTARHTIHLVVFEPHPAAVRRFHPHEASEIVPHERDLITGRALLTDERAAPVRVRLRAARPVQPRAAVRKRKPPAITRPAENGSLESGRGRPMLVARAIPPCPTIHSDVRDARP